jgi:hypothetical protein
MIVVSVQVWPMGLEEQRSTIAVARIENQGHFGNGYHYRAEVSEVGNPHLGIPPFDRVTEVFGHDRHQSVWHLVGQMIRNAEVPTPSTDVGTGSTTFDSYALGLFLDVLPAAWGLLEADVEQLLDVPVGWLRAWRNHEVQIDRELASDILDLGAIQIGMRLLRTPDGYRGFWHHCWGTDSSIGARTPWQAFVEDGRPALDAIRRHLRNGFQ